MLRIPFLRNLLFLVLVIACCMPLYTLFVLHPAYHHQLVAESEEESGRFAAYLVRALGLQGIRMEREFLPATVAEQVEMIRGDQHLIKLRIFSPGGDIVFSTDGAEIGKANTSDYFRDIVAKGKVFSKVVEKDHKTADGVVSKLDVVETYVPFMAGGKFDGAIEVYNNITVRVAKINALTLRTTLILVLLSGGFVVAMVLALNKAKVSLEERGKAESALRQMNEELEGRVAGRTAELSEANVQLTSEIAERTLAQMALSQALEDSRRDREKLDGILRSVSDGLVVTDYQLAVLHMNAAAEKLLGIPLEKALGQPLDRLSGVTTFPTKVRGLLANTRSSHVFDFELPGTDPRHPRVFEARFSRLESDQDRPGAILLIHDVTREREVEQMKNAFLGMAAHELNTPLTAILGFTELLTQQETISQLGAEQTDEYLRLIHQKALALSRLIDDLLDISRVEAGQPLALDISPVHLDELLREVLRPYQDSRPRHQFELHLVTPQAQVEADPGRLRQVFDNLLSNAVKYSPQGGAIRVIVEGGGDRYQVRVVDQGIGMNAEQVEHIFDRFYRADSSNTAVQGVGLGMSIVRHIVLAHQGEIDVASQPGAGTTVRIDLPVRPEGVPQSPWH